jgi:hypothetical protein
MRDITYKSIACGPSGSFQPGEKRHDVPDAEAAALVNGGYAAYADSPRPAPVERAVITPAVEQAVAPEQPVIPQPQVGRTPPRRGR